MEVRELALGLATLVNVVKGQHDRLARVDGESLERKYRQKGAAYFGPIARRLRLVDPSDLVVTVDDAVDAGTITEREAQHVMLADGVFQGRRDGAAVHLLLEASVTVDHDDVARARQLADVLARVVATPVIAVVAGEFVPSQVASAARESNVWQVTDGQVTAPA